MAEAKLEEGRTNVYNQKLFKQRLSFDEAQDNITTQPYCSSDFHYLGSELQSMSHTEQCNSIVMVELWLIRKEVQEQ